MSSDDPGGSAEEIRRDFARAWGRIGATWGVAPSTAAVQGYLLVHGGPLTEAELRAALDLSPRAMRHALAECEEWGIVERAPERRRSGQRGPAGVAWVPLADNWEWFRRVAEARKRRETDPVVPVLRECYAAAEAVAGGAGAGEEAAALRDRVGSLLQFVLLFDRSVGGVVRADPAALERFVSVAGRLEPDALDRLLRALAELPEEDLERAAASLARLSPRAIGRLVRALGRPGVGRVLGGLR
jgi:DNA-binding transcriptional regulator GbsR (MarR family)